MKKKSTFKDKINKSSMENIPGRGEIVFIENILIEGKSVLYGIYPQTEGNL